MPRGEGVVMLQDLESSTVEILRGLGRADPESLTKLTEVDDWRRIAAIELERRATLFIQSLDEATVKAIARGDLDLSRLSQMVLAEAGSSR